MGIEFGAPSKEILLATLADSGREGQRELTWIRQILYLEKCECLKQAVYTLSPLVTLRSPRAYRMMLGTSNSKYRPKNLKRKFKNQNYKYFITPVKHSITSTCTSTYKCDIWCRCFLIWWVVRPPKERVVRTKKVSNRRYFKGQTLRGNLKKCYFSRHCFTYLKNNRVSKLGSPEAGAS